MIEANQLTKRFGILTALDQISFQIQSGSIFGLVGSNGAGKSTFLRTLAGIYQPDGGSVTLDGEAPFENPGVKSRIFFIPDYQMCIRDSFLRFLLRNLYRFRLCRHPVAVYKKIHGQMKMFHDSAKIMGTSVKVYVKTIFFTIVQITLAGLIPYFIYRCFNLPLNPDATVFTMLAAQTFVTMVSAFVPLPGSSGGAEGSFYLFFGPFFGATIIPAILLSVSYTHLDVYKRQIR